MRGLQKNRQCQWDNGFAHILCSEDQRCSNQSRKRNLKIHQTCPVVREAEEHGLFIWLFMDYSFNKICLAHTLAVRTARNILCYCHKYCSTSSGSARNKNVFLEYFNGALHAGWNAKIKFKWIYNKLKSILKKKIEMNELNGGLY